MARKPLTCVFEKEGDSFRIPDNETFCKLYGEAANDGEKEVFVSDYSVSYQVLGEHYTEDDMIAASAMLADLWDDANRGIAEIRAALGLTQKQFAHRFCIPQQTISAWEADRRSPPAYLILLMSDMAGLSKVKRGPADEQN